MKNIRSYIIALLCIVLLSACEKRDTPGVASLNVFNGITGSNLLVTNFNGTHPLVWYRSAHRLSYGDPGDVAAYNSVRNRLYSYSGPQRITFFEYPDTLAHSVPVTEVQVDLPVSSINTLFLTGTVQAPDAFFLHDVLPHHAITDSVVSIRVVNLVKGLTVSVNLQGEAGGSEVQSLEYKAVSGFKDYDVKKVPEIYEFEIRNKSTGNLITTQTMDTRDRDIGYGLANLHRFRNFTIILFGDASAPRSVVMSNN